jgi:hypothetical protein
MHATFFLHKLPSKVSLISFFYVVRTKGKKISQPSPSPLDSSHETAFKEEINEIQVRGKRTKAHDVPSHAQGRGRPIPQATAHGPHARVEDPMFMLLKMPMMITSTCLVLRGCC